jgi:hypothetical protein
MACVCGAGDGSVALRKSRKEEEKELGLLGGERVLTKQEGVLFSHHALHQGKWGHLWITNFRLIFAVKVFTQPHTHTHHRTRTRARTRHGLTTISS